MTNSLKNYAAAAEKLKALRQANTDLVAHHYPPGTRIQTLDGPATVIGIEPGFGLDCLCLLHYTYGIKSFGRMAITDRAPEKLGDK